MEVREPKFAFVIPAYQHSLHMRVTIEALLKFQYPILVVNDGSDAHHTEIIRVVCKDFAGRVHLFEHEHNLGKGGAVITGFREAHKLGCTHVLQIDADGQHDLNSVQALLNLSKENPDALVSGAPIYDDSIPLGRKIGRHITHFWVWIETLSFKIKDSMCGFRIYPLAATLPIVGRQKVGLRMDFDIEIMVRLYWAQTPVIFLEVPVIYPEEGTSNFKVFADNVKISWAHTRLFFGMLLRWPLLLFNNLFPPAKNKHWSSTGERGMVLGIWTVFFLYKVLGRRVIGFVLWWICFYYQFFARSARRASLQFQNTYTEYARKNNVPLKKVSFFRHLFAFSRSMLDKLAVWQGMYKKSIIDSEDLKVFTDLKNTSPGGVFISAHFGNIEMARALGHNNLEKKFTALVYTDHALKFNKCLEAVNGQSTMTMMSVASFTPEVAIELNQRVDRGEWVFIMGDRTSATGSGQSLTLDVLGAPAELPVGPFLLGYLLDVPVYSFFCYQQDRRVRIEFNEITPQLNRTKQNRQAFIAQLAQSYVADLNQVILKSPMQWFNFFNFWKSNEA